MCKECEENVDIKEDELCGEVKNNNTRIRKMYWEGLPRWNSGNNKGQTKWDESIGCIVKFQYHDILGELKIIDYNPNDRYLYLEYLDKEIFKLFTGNFQDCKLGKLLDKHTNKFKMETGIRLKDDKRDLIILDREYRHINKNNAKHNYKWYKYKCNKCGWEDGWTVESSLLSGNGCSCCDGRTVVEGINDIPTTTPWMIPYFQGGYDEAKLYTKGSNKKILFKCPDCGRVKDKKSMINKVYSNKSIGCSCGDGFSMPEKFIYSTLKQLGIEFQTQLNKTDFEWCDKYKYDFYIPSINLILEAHGLQHYTERTGSYSKSLQEEQENDKIKKELSLRNGIKEEKYIVIDCRYSDLEWIKNNILNGELNKVFNFNNINWLKAEEFALSNLVKKACEIKRDNPNMSTTDIGKIIELNRSTILRYLEKGSKIWDWCNYDTKEELKKRVSKSILAISKSVEIFKDNLSLGIFSSGSELSRQSKELFGINLNSRNISATCNKKQKSHKGFTFKFIDTDLTS